MKKNTNFPCINWFGAILIVRELLVWYNSFNEDEEEGENGGFFSKMNKQNLIDRQVLVLSAVQKFGLTIEAAQFIQSPTEGVKGFFNNVTAEALYKEMTDIVERLKRGPKFAFSTTEFGTLDFTFAEDND